MYGAMIFYIKLSVFYFLLIVNKINYIESFKIQHSKLYKLMRMNKESFIVTDNSKSTNTNKLIAYKKLLRTNNVFPTFLLNTLAGWLTIPSYTLFLNKKFWLFSLITQLTMMNSMVINDIFDLKIDLINNSDRPLVRKEITIKESQCLYVTTSIITNLLGIIFFNNNNFYIYISTINLLLFLYTPILKKILFIKNITCATVVSSTIILTSKSLSLNCDKLITKPNLINITSVFLFLSSLYIELLLDIKDIKGDKENNINTIPNFYGIQKTLNLLTLTFTSNLLYHSGIFYANKKYKLLIGFVISNLYFFKNLLKLRKGYEKYILDSISDTTKSLIIFIITVVLSR
jgi:4-hydroxybenzoate polyprenyltransferase